MSATPDCPDRSLEPIMVSLEEPACGQLLLPGWSRTPAVRSATALPPWPRDCDDTFFVAVGGGGVIDTVKAAVVVAAHGGSAIDYQRGERKIELPPISLSPLRPEQGPRFHPTRLSPTLPGRRRLSWRAATLAPFCAARSRADPGTAAQGYGGDGNGCADQRD